MLRNNRILNEDIKANGDFLSKLFLHFPEFFSNTVYDDQGYIIEYGNFNIERFKDSLIENNINEIQDGYQLSFLGKDYAKKQTGEKPNTVIVPDNQHNYYTENKNSKNIFLTGDNLEALKHLQKNYRNSIDLIYIDPPYNTGNDNFVYPDNFEYSDEVLKTIFALNDDDLTKLKSIQGKATHSAWLTFMYPRLALAKYLLKETGVIFISIDDNEQYNLRFLMDSIFGEACFVSNVIWQKKFSPQNDATYFSNMHDHILCYAKKKKSNSNDTGWNRILIERKEAPSQYSNPDNDPNGIWSSGDFTAEGPTPNCIYEIVAPNGKKHLPPQGKRWVYNYENYKILREQNRFWFGKDGTSYPRIKRYWNEVQQGLVPNSIWFHEEVGHTQEGKQEVNSLFDGSVFDYPKPTRLIKRIINLSLAKDGIVLDFFAGSSTTADALLQLNAEDGGNRRFIMVQIDEPTFVLDSEGNKVPRKGSEQAFKSGYMSIDEISRERIRRACKSIRENNGLTLPDNFDGGFKHYRIVKPNQATLNDLDMFDPSIGMFVDSKGNTIAFTENGFDDMIKPFSSSALNVPGDASGVDTILTTWMVQDGYQLDSEINELILDSYTVYYIEESRLYLIDENWNSVNTQALLNKLGKYELSTQTIVIYGYSFSLESLREIELGLKQLPIKVNLVKRY